MILADFSLKTQYVKVEGSLNSLSQKNYESLKHSTLNICFFPHQVWFPGRYFLLFHGPQRRRDLVIFKTQESFARREEKLLKTT